jgi:hypothetical protein
MNEITNIIIDYINKIDNLNLNIINNRLINDYMQLNYIDQEIRDLEIINNNILNKNNEIKFIELGIINLYKSYIIYKYKKIYYLIIIINNNYSEIELSIFNNKKDINKYINL